MKKFFMYRSFTAVKGSWVTSIVACITALSAQAQSNIVFIMVDDSGIGDYSSYAPSTPVLTPNIDALAAGGMVFNNAYAGANVCGPTRSSLMTGQHLGNASMRGNFNTAHIRDQDFTWAEMLSDEGYATGGFGKWGLGSPSTIGAPEHQGFDEWVGYYHQVHAHDHYTDRLYDTGQTLLIPENSGFNEPGSGLVSTDRTHAHNVIVDRMKSFIAINAQANQPFVAYGAWTPPHTKTTMPEDDPAYALYENMPDWSEKQKIQAAFITMIDRQIGEIVDLLDDPNGDDDHSDSVLNDTLIIFTSDNGGQANTSAYDRNAGLRGNKGRNYEGGLRVPFIASWAGQILPGTSSDILTYSPDMMATFADVAGIPEAVPANTDGISILPEMLGQAQTEHAWIYFETHKIQPNGGHGSALRMGDWKAMRGSVNGSIELYNLSVDPFETNNIAAANPAIVAQISAVMDAEHSPMRPQFNVNPPTVGNASKDGIVAFGIRPDTDIRDWTITEAGDALSLSGQLLDDQADTIGLHLDDLDQTYGLTVNVQRVGADAPEILVEVLGQSGVVYFSCSVDTNTIGEGEALDISLALTMTDVTPSAGALGGDLGHPLTLRFFHAGRAGEILVADASVGMFGIEGEIRGDLNMDGQLNADN